jgi:hypothetical protein
MSMKIQFIQKRNFIALNACFRKEERSESIHPSSLLGILEKNIKLSLTHTEKTSKN